MNKKLAIFLSALGLVIILLATYFIFFFGKSPEVEVSCLEINNELNFEIVACYDAYSGNIYLELFKRSDGYSVKGFYFSFFDFEEKSFDSVEEILKGRSYFYKVPAERNPAVGYFDFIVSSSNKCGELRSIPIGYCPASLSQANLQANLTLVSQGTIADFKDISKKFESDFLSKELVDRDSVWSAVCESNWDCGSWGDCFEGLRKRDCVDLSDCVVPTEIPKRVASCEGFCSEDWSCEWSKCVDGVSTPSCVDFNGCGTERDKPSEISCSKKCIPDVYCNDWSFCNVDYDLLDVRYDEYFYKGFRTRLCQDRDNCVNSVIETKDCSLQVDVYTKIFDKCGKEYIGLYNSLTDEILATMQKDIGEVSSLNIDLTSSAEGIYCGYCYDGTLNGDEEQIDCGGSCLSCEDYVVFEDYKLNFFEKIVKWFSS